MSGVVTGLRAIRRAADISQRQLGAIVGVHHTYISHIEHGADRPSRALVQRIDEALGQGGALVAAFDAEPCPRCGRTGPKP